MQTESAYRWITSGPHAAAQSQASRFVSVGMHIHTRFIKLKIPLGTSHTFCFPYSILDLFNQFNDCISADKILENSSSEALPAVLVLADQLTDLPNVAPKWGMWLGDNCKGSPGLYLL